MSAAMKIIARLFSVCGLLVLFILPPNRYSWMQEMDPSIMADDPSGNRKVFSLLILIIIGLIELILFIKDNKVAGKIVSLILAASAVLIWSIKYLSV